MTEVEKQQVSRLSEEGFGYKKIAAMLSISPDTVKSYCRRQGIRKATPVADAQPVVTTTCKCCGLPIIQKPKMKPRVFCSDGCRRAFFNANRQGGSHVCPHCGREFKAYGKRTYCSHSCARKAHSVSFDTAAKTLDI